MDPKQNTSASVSDVLTTLKNLVLAVGTAAQNYLNVQGLAIAQALTAPTVVKTTGGRVCRVSVTVQGSSTGTIYDGATLSATSKPIYIIPMAVGVVEVNLPVGFGILVAPGTGQTVSVSYS